jgi:hypothetical protein
MIHGGPNVDVMTTYVRRADGGEGGGGGEGGDGGDGAAELIQGGFHRPAKLPIKEWENR